jgi:bacterioferritin
MKGDKKVLDALNKALAEELTAISQYMVHSEMCDKWGYTKLHKAIEKVAIDEMKHAEALIGRILQYEGIPIVSNLNAMNIGKNVEEILKNDLAGELDAVKSYNDAITVAAACGDNLAADFLTGIQKDEEGHAEWQETQLAQIKQMGLAVYLTTQV